ncbi:MAG: phosphoenolpyruvate--protein phosphotransferase [Phycisphaeraceae bacterium]|nr:phosphoenolpyruvate--protein phosphotransferase [Phycisphaeraceae bacterium]MCW5755394.1 phosphoenolpyruvate--protein phosphotransferase [Phycisphaeraceae bacterium]
MQLLEGIPVSPGVVVGRAFILDQPRLRVSRRCVPADAVEIEIERFEQARRASIEDLNRVHHEAESQIGPEAAKIFLFHIGMLHDKALIGPVHERIREDCLAAEAAAAEVLREWSDRFLAMGDSAFTTKADDLNDLSERVLGHLVGQRRRRLEQAGEHAIVVARDLTPSQAVALGKARVTGFATDLGGRTSHTAIVAKALHIPAVVGCRWITERVSDGQTLIVDGDRGRVIIEPDSATLDEYTTYSEQRASFSVSLGELTGLEAVTADGVPIELLANIEFPEEAAEAVQAGAVGVGLYRTEFLYLTSDAVPTEQDHFDSYLRAIELLAGRPLTIRTVDLGADKYTQQRVATPERNPMLGNRSIRYCFRALPMFRTQLRAILRASAHGPVKVMFPLISSPSEFRQARLYVREVMEDLDDEGIPYDRSIPVGMMVEVPSAALLMNFFAREADFFSIGTNDLVQYTLAVDRTNEEVAGLYDPAHPAVLRLVRHVLRIADRAGKPPSVCGESAADPEYALLLMGLGLRTLSLTSSSIPALKRVIRMVTIQDCKRIAEKALTFDSGASVTAYVRDQARKLLPEGFTGRSGSDSSSEKTSGAAQRE